MLTNYIQSQALPASSYLGRFINVTSVFAPVITSAVGVYCLSRVPRGAVSSVLSKQAAGPDVPRGVVPGQS